MRISSAEADKIKTAAERCFGAGTIVRLFGSRADDARRGGDIDLQIIAANEAAISLDVNIFPALKDEDFRTSPVSIDLTGDVSS